LSFAFVFFSWTFICDLEELPSAHGGHDWWQKPKDNKFKASILLFNLDDGWDWTIPFFGL
jgi:hypothetical protein